MKKRPLWRTIVSICLAVVLALTSVNVGFGSLIANAAAATMSKIAARNGGIDVQLEAAPDAVPVVSDFTATYKLDGGAATSISLSDLTFDAENNVVSLEYSKIEQTDYEQKVEVALSLNGVEKTASFKIPGIADVEIVDYAQEFGSADSTKSDSTGVSISNTTIAAEETTNKWLKINRVSGDYKYIFGDYPGTAYDGTYSLTFKYMAGMGIGFMFMYVDETNYRSFAYDGTQWVFEYPVGDGSYNTSYPAVTKVGGGSMPSLQIGKTYTVKFEFLNRQNKMYIKEADSDTFIESQPILQGVNGTGKVGIRCGMVPQDLYGLITLK